VDGYNGNLEAYSRPGEMIFDVGVSQ
jgi:hypothetical protein